MFSLVLDGVFSWPESRKIEEGWALAEGVAYFVKAVHARKHVELFLEHVFRALFALVILVDFDVPVVDLTDLLL